jgi:NAD(P)-dependent dehydrogenase (short-subunit alcohol dehydrogenase family)
MSNPRQQRRRRSAERAGPRLRCRSAGGGRIDTNLTGTYLVTGAVLPMMATRRTGHQSSSCSDDLAWPGTRRTAPRSTRVIGFTRALALELAATADHRQRDLPWMGGYRDGEAGYARPAHPPTGQTFEQFRDAALGRVPIQRIIQPERGRIASPRFSRRRLPRRSPVRRTTFRGRTNHGLGQ